MKDRRSIFALDYIELTVSHYVSLLESSCEPQTLLWAHDVLEEYFRVVDDTHPKLIQLKKVFDSTCNPKSTDESNRIPFVRDFKEDLGISVENFHYLAKRRRSCRWFLSKKVPRELIDSAIEIGTLAPSACNRQPFEFIVFDEPTDAQRIGELAGGTKGFAQNFPCLAVLVGDFSAYPFERDRHLPYIDGSLASMGFLFGLEIQGISSCCINWPDIEFKEQKIDAELNLPADKRVLMLIAIGYPDREQMVPYSQKKAIDSIRSYRS